MADVKVFADKQTEKQMSQKLYAQSIDAGALKKFKPILSLYGNSHKTQFSITLFETFSI